MKDSQQDAAGLRLLLRRCTPPAALTGFLALLVVVFAVAYATGSAAGPVAPGLHPGKEQSAGPVGEDSGEGGSGHMDGMGEDR